MVAIDGDNLLFFSFLNRIFLAEKPLFHNFVNCPTTDFYQKNNI